MTRNEKKLSGFIKHLRNHLPADRKVIVRIKPLTKDHGEVRYGNKAYVITLDSAATFHVKIDTILHEWAHILDLPWEAREEHRDSWGVQYSRVYREYLKFKEANRGSLFPTRVE